MQAKVLLVRTLKEHQSVRKNLEGIVGFVLLLKRRTETPPGCSHVTVEAPQNG